MSSPDFNVPLPSEALGMGNPIAEYRSATATTWLSGIILGGIGLCMITSVFVLKGQNFSIVAGLVGLFLLVGAGQQIAAAIRGRNLRVIVLDKGLVSVGGGKTEVIHWEDVTTVYQAITAHYHYGIKAGTSYEFSLWLRNKSKVVFKDTIRNVKDLGSTIQRETSNRLLPKYAEAFNSGRTVTFGKLTLSKAGINNGKDTLPWDQVEAININQGQISVRKQGKWLGWAGQTAAATPNLFVFLTLVDQIVGINQKQK